MPSPPANVQDSKQSPRLVGFDSERSSKRSKRKMKSCLKQRFWGKLPDTETEIRKETQKGERYVLSRHENTDDST